MTNPSPYISENLNTLGEMSEAIERAFKVLGSGEYEKQLFSLAQRFAEPTATFEEMDFILSQVADRKIFDKVPLTHLFNDYLLSHHLDYEQNPPVYDVIRCIHKGSGGTKETLLRISVVENAIFDVRHTSQFVHDFLFCAVSQDVPEDIRDYILRSFGERLQYKIENEDKSPDPYLVQEYRNTLYSAPIPQEKKEAYEKAYL